ncbi:MAG: riboflavin biosynthesis protein RibF [Chthoniobacterales bacterium]
MKILQAPEELSSLNTPVVLAAGVFDGLHLGHAQVIGEAKRISSEIPGSTPVVMSFSQHPAQILRPDRAPKMLYGDFLKKYHLEKLGIQTLLELPFTHEFAELSPNEFLRRLCTKKSPLAAICVGSDWTFGKDRSGTLETLREQASNFGFKVHEISAVSLAGKTISSTRIRNALLTGNLDEANSCLGRPWSIYGRVTQGKGLGKKLNFPTANIRTDIDILLKNGVYAVHVASEENLHPLPAVANIGLRPSIDDKTTLPVLEVHLLNFDGNLYTKNLEVRFLSRLRDEKKFATLEELRAAIAEDIKAAQRIFFRAS